MTGDDSESAGTAGDGHEGEPAAHDGEGDAS